MPAVSFYIKYSRTPETTTRPCPPRWLKIRYYFELKYAISDRDGHVNSKKSLKFQRIPKIILSKLSSFYVLSRDRNMFVSDLPCQYFDCECRKCFESLFRVLLLECLPSFPWPLVQLHLTMQERIHHPKMIQNICNGCMGVEMILLDHTWKEREHANSLIPLTVYNCRSIENGGSYFCTY